MEEVIEKGIAIKEIQKFVEIHDDQKKPDYQIETDYPQAIKAVCLGLLTFDEHYNPKYKLKNPINENGDFPIKDINFRTRIKPTDLANIMKGVNIAQNQLEYTMRAFTYIARLESKAMLDLLSKFDYKVIEQISTVFL